MWVKMQQPPESTLHYEEWLDWGGLRLAAAPGS